MVDRRLVERVEAEMLRAADALGLEVSIKAIRPLAEAAARAVEAAAAAPARRPLGMPTFQPPAAPGGGR